MRFQTYLILSINIINSLLLVRFLYQINILIIQNYASINNQLTYIEISVIY